MNITMRLKHTSDNNNNRKHLNFDITDLGRNTEKLNSEENIANKMIRNLIGRGENNTKKSPTGKKIEHREFNTNL